MVKVSLVLTWHIPIKPRNLAKGNWDLSRKGASGDRNQTAIDYWQKYKFSFAADTSLCTHGELYRIPYRCRVPAWRAPLRGAHESELEKGICFLSVQRNTRREQRIDFILPLAKDLDRCEYASVPAAHFTVQINPNSVNPPHELKITKDLYIAGFCLWTVRHFSASGSSFPVLATTHCHFCILSHTVHVENGYMLIWLNPVDAQIYRCVSKGFFP